MPTDDNLTFEVDDRGVARLTLDRPEVHNAFDDVLIAALDRRLAAVEADGAIRALVLAANGRSFSAGADLAWMRRAADYPPERNRADAEALALMLERLDRLRCPTVALVQGATFGGGVGLVACCDIAIAAARAKFSLSEVRLGLVPGVISPFVVRAIGARQARRFFLTGERMDARAALRIGLLHDVVDDEAALAAAGAAVVADLLAGGPQAVASAKALIAAVEGRPHDAELRARTVDFIARARGSDEGREGLAAFLARRAPAWRAEDE